MTDVYAIFGWIGMALIVGAYYLNTTKKVRGHDLSYLLMNLAGTIGIGVNVYHQQAWPTFALQVAWGAITLYAIRARRK